MKLFKYIYKALKHWVYYDDYIKERLKWPYSYEAYSKTIGRETYLNVMLPIIWYIIVIVIAILEFFILWRFLYFVFELRSFNDFFVDLFTPTSVLLIKGKIDNDIFNSFFVKYPLDFDMGYEKILFMCTHYKVHIILSGLWLVWLDSLLWAFARDLDGEEDTDEEMDIYFSEHEETPYATFLIWVTDRFSASVRHAFFLPIYFFHINISLFLLIRFFFPFPYPTYLTMYNQTVELFDLSQLLDLYLFFLLPHSYILFYTIFFVWHEYSYQCRWMDHDYEHSRSVDLAVQVSYKMIYISFLYVVITFYILLYLIEIYFDLTKGFLFLGQRIFLTKYDIFLLEGNLEVPDFLYFYIDYFYELYLNIFYKIFSYIFTPIFLWIWKTLWTILTYDGWFFSQVWQLTMGIDYHMHYPEEIRSKFFTFGSWFVMFFMLFFEYAISDFLPDLYLLLASPDYQIFFLSLLKIIYTYIWLFFLAILWLKFVIAKDNFYTIPVIIIWLNDKIKQNGFAFFKDIIIYFYIILLRQKAIVMFDIKEKGILIFLFKILYKITGLYLVIRFLIILKNILIKLFIWPINIYRLLCFYVASIIEKSISYLSNTVVFFFLTKIFRALTTLYKFFFSICHDNYNRLYYFFTKDKVEREALYVEELLEAVEKGEYKIKASDLDVIKSKAYTERKFVKLLVLKYHNELLENRRKQAFLEQMEKRYGKDIISNEDHKQAKKVNMKKYE